MEFVNERDAEHAKKVLNGHRLNGLRLKIGRSQLTARVEEVSPPQELPSLHVPLKVI